MLYAPDIVSIPGDIIQKEPMVKEKGAEKGKGGKGKGKRQKTGVTEFGNGLAAFLTHTFWAERCSKCIITAHDMVVVDAPETEFYDVTLEQLENGVRKSVGVLEHYLYTGLAIRMRSEKQTPPPMDPARIHLPDKTTTLVPRDEGPYLNIHNFTHAPFSFCTI